MAAGYVKWCFTCLNRPVYILGLLYLVSALFVADWGQCAAQPQTRVDIAMFGELHRIRRTGRRAIFLQHVTPRMRHRPSPTCYDLTATPTLDFDTFYSFKLGPNLEKDGNYPVEPLTVTCVDTMPHHPAQPQTPPLFTLESRKSALVLSSTSCDEK
jgi:hypothetical protein